MVCVDKWVKINFLLCTNHKLICIIIYFSWHEHYLISVIHNITIHFSFIIVFITAWSTIYWRILLYAICETRIILVLGILGFFFCIRYIFILYTYHCEEKCHNFKRLGREMNIILYVSCVYVININLLWLLFSKYKVKLLIIEYDGSD